MVATRLSWLAKMYTLLPLNHFKARRRRSYKQALNLLYKKIYKAWEKRLVLTLITFNI
jgi:hypothetical protein